MLTRLAVLTRLSLFDAVVTVDSCHCGCPTVSTGAASSSMLCAGLVASVHVCVHVGWLPAHPLPHSHLPPTHTQVEVCIKRLRMDAPELAAALNRIDTDKLKVGPNAPPPPPPLAPALKPC